MWDYILNKVSKYLKEHNKGEVVSDPEQIRRAKAFLGCHEVEDKVVLKSFLGFNPATTPWCAGFVNAVEKRCGRNGTGKLLARSFLKYGTAVGTPRLGDIVVFKRGNSSWQGHVGYYISEENGKVLSLGGNQSNKVCYAYYPKSSVIGYRRPQ